MTITRRVELTCRRADVRRFEQIGMSVVTKAVTTGKPPVGTCMVHPAADDIVITTMVAIGLEGTPFTAEIASTDGFSEILVVSFKKQIVTLQKLGESTAPVLAITKNGFLSVEGDSRYWDTKAKFEDALRSEEVNA